MHVILYLMYMYVAKKNKRKLHTMNNVMLSFTPTTTHTADPPTTMAPNTQVQKFTSTPYSAMPDTRPEMSTYTSTDIITQTTDIVQVSHEQSSTQSDFLPWLLMGIMTVLFCALLSINIICCIVCLLKKHRKRRYQLKRNPSYASSPRTLSAHNAGFENHIYDFIHTT